MIRLYIMLNNRRRFVFSTAMAAVFVLLAGGANALAAPTVRCVTTLSVNPSCTVAYGTIGAAVSAASIGDTIFVGPGTYNESVTITTGFLGLFGAQAGNDARVGRQNPAKESIVNAPAGTSAIIVAANFVVIDGFTVQGGTAGASPPPLPAGIYLKPGQALTQVINNILQNNSTGAYLSGAVQAVIEHNLFRNNNAGTAPNSGYGIFLEAAHYSAIAENEFTGNNTAAIDDDGSLETTITNNTSENGGSFVIYTNTSYGRFSHNRGKDLGRGAFSGAGDAAVAVGPGNLALVISDNDLEKGKAPISNGIAFTTAFATVFGTNPNVQANVTNNKIQGFPGNGIVAEASPGGVGTLDESSIAGNEVYDNGNDGIFIEGASSNNIHNSLYDNEAESNHVNDCEDDTTTGIGTLGTESFWSNNTGNLSSPPGLCSKK